VEVELDSGRVPLPKWFSGAPTDASPWLISVHQRQARQRRGKNIHPTS